MLQKILFFFLCISCSAAQAQSWQWGVRGGGIADNSTGQETVVDMATDAHGNVYALSRVNGANGSITVGNITKNTIGGTSDMLVTSYNCNGQLRWLKVIGTNSSNDTPNAISVDGTNNVYVSGFMPPLSTTLYFDTDTIQSNHTKNFFIISYDSSGLFRWLKQPGSDTITDLIRQDRLKRYSDIVGSPSGGVYNMSYMPKGLLAGGDGVVVPQDGMYITEYNANGNIVKLTALDMQVNPLATGFQNIRMVRMPSGKFVVGCRVTGSGTPPTNYNLSVGGVLVNYPTLLACFGINGNLLWHKENSIQSTSGNGIMYRPVFMSGYIYIAGRASSNNNSSFGGVSIINNISVITTVGFVSKVDSFGNVIFLKNTSNSTVANADGGVSVNNVMVSISGSYTLDLQLSTQKLQNEPNQGYDIFLATLDANTGNTIALDSLDSDFGYNDAASAMVSDNKGNIYISGEMGNKLYVGTADTLQSSGGSSDFFIAKFGTANCSNSVVPITLKAFTANLKQQQIQCSWQSEQEVNSSHYIVQRSVNEINYSNIATLPTKGSGNQYNYTDSLPKQIQQVTKTLYYRLAMVNKDGSIQYSPTVAVQLNKQNQVQVYPNPVKEQLTLVLTQTSSSKQLVQLFSLQGKQILQSYVPANSSVLQIPVKTISKGSYILKVGAYSTLIVKE